MVVLTSPMLFKCLEGVKDEVSDEKLILTRWKDVDSTKHEWLWVASWYQEWMDRSEKDPPVKIAEESTVVEKPAIVKRPATQEKPADTKGSAAAKSGAILKKTAPAKGVVSKGSTNAKESVIVKASAATNKPLMVEQSAVAKGLVEEGSKMGYWILAVILLLVLDVIREKMVNKPLLTFA